MPKYNSKKSERTQITRQILENIEKKPDYRARIRESMKISHADGITHDIFNHLEEIGVIKQTPDDPHKEKSPIFVEITEKGLGYLLSLQEYGIGLK